MKFKLKLKKKLVFKIVKKAESRGIECFICHTAGLTNYNLTGKGLACYGCIEEARAAAFSRRESARRKSDKKAPVADVIAPKKKVVLKFKLKIKGK